MFRTLLDVYVCIDLFHCCCLCICSAAGWGETLLYWKQEEPLHRQEH